MSEAGIPSKNLLLIEVTYDKVNNGNVASLPIGLTVLWAAFPFLKIV